MDGLEEAAETGKRALVYPFEAVPQRGLTIEVAPGVHWIRMPLTYALDHINLWALDDGAGWAVVDTGVRTEETAAVWRELFANAPDDRTLTRVFVTHMHPDHVGMAGWLTRKFGVRLWMTRLEYLSCRVMVSDTGREAPDDAIAFYRRAGWSEVAIETYRAPGSATSASTSTRCPTASGGFATATRCRSAPTRGASSSAPDIRPNMPAWCRPRGADLGRSGPAEDFFRRLRLPDRAGCRSDGRLACLARQVEARRAGRRARAAVAQRMLSRPACPHRCTAPRSGALARTAATRAEGTQACRRRLRQPVRAHHRRVQRHPHERTDAEREHGGPGSGRMRCGTPG